MFQIIFMSPGKVENVKVMENAYRTIENIALENRLLNNRHVQFIGYTYGLHRQTQGRF